MNINKVVIPVAGWGTRSLPASKNIPKEMLPIYNKPVVQYVVEEAMAAGIEDVILVTNRYKTVIEDHFDHNLQLESVLERAGKDKLLEQVRSVADMVNVFAVRQKEQKGLGHAVLCARQMVEHDDAFAVMLGDDIMLGEDAGLIQLVRLAQERNMPVVGVMEVPEDKVNRYGIAEGDEIEPGIINVTRLVEKPAVGTVKSRMALIGRYVITPDIFDFIENTAPGAGGEIQLTDALAALAKKRGMLAVKMNGLRFDAGDWVDYLAANVYFGLQDSNLREDLKKKILPMVS